ncbi:hypothetical protein IFM89_011863 [Coptis chinensis]|uniref:Cytochrome P450 n=1 Tax=Coptis chinensis TaxID=261450 RepID=A0A835HXM0_9MAGN|nr:hypothetical protein IFM89_011863 [Coptis chinensis]
MGAIDVDWRDFFPYLRWFPNKSLEMNIERMDKRRKAVMKTLIGQQEKRIASGEDVSHSYVSFMLSEAKVIPLTYAHEDTELGGYHIPAGSEIAINIYGCSMDKKQWDEPEKWKPDRFFSSEYDSTDMYKTMAFGGGKRICTGSQQGMTISCMAIGRFVQEFKWRLMEREKDDVDTLGLTSSKLNPMCAILTVNLQD